MTIHVAVVQSLSRDKLFATLWTAGHQASLSFIISQSLFTLMTIESVILSNHLILCWLLLFLPSTFPGTGLTQVSRISDRFFTI